MVPFIYLSFAWSRAVNGIVSLDPRRRAEKSESLIENICTNRQTAGAVYRILGTVPGSIHNPVFEASGIGREGSASIRGIP